MVTEAVKVVEFKVLRISIECRRGEAGTFDVVVNRRESRMW